MTDRTRVSDAPQHTAPAKSDNFDRTALYNGYKSLNQGAKGQQGAQDLTLTNPYTQEAAKPGSGTALSRDRLDNIHAWEDKIDARLDKINARVEQLSPAAPEKLINRRDMLQDNLNRLESRFPNGDTA